MKKGTEAEGEEIGRSCAMAINGGGNNNGPGGILGGTNNNNGGGGGILGGGGAWTKQDEDKWLASCVTDPKYKEMCSCVLQKNRKKIFQL